MARPVGLPVDVEDILVRKEENVVFEEMADKALAGRPEMRLIDNAIRQSGQEVWLAASGLYPQITMNYNYIKEGDEPGVAGSDYHDADRWEAMAACSLNIWEWGKNYYAIKEKKSLKKELMHTRNAVKDNIVLEVKDAVLHLETALENIPTTQKAVLQGEENLRVNEEGYKAQTNTLTDVLDAQTLLTRARVNYYKALYTHNLAMANLLRAVGTY
jgi:outer membrane protein